MSIKIFHENSEIFDIQFRVYNLNFWSIGLTHKDVIKRLNGTKRKIVNRIIKNGGNDQNFY